MTKEQCESLRQNMLDRLDKYYNGFIKPFFSAGPYKKTCDAHEFTIKIQQDLTNVIYAAEASCDSKSLKGFPATERLVCIMK